MYFCNLYFIKQFNIDMLKSQCVMLAFEGICVLLTHVHAVSLPSGSSPPPAKEPVTAVTANSTTTSAAQLQNSDAFAAVAQLFQSSQGQQVCAY